MVHPVRVDIESGLPHKAQLPVDKRCFPQHRGKHPATLCRHHFSGRYSLLYQPSFQDEAHVDLRIYDYSRYYVPRRLRVPLVTLEEIINRENTEANDYLSGRVRRPVLFPGAAYDVSEIATGLRGRVIREGQPMCWAWIEAHLIVPDGAGGITTTTLVGQARGDDRGEFLLLLNSHASPTNTLNSTIPVRLTVFGSQDPPEQQPTDLPSEDALWDLPREELPSPGDPDNVSSGELIPAGYAEGAATRDVDFRIGRILSGVEVDDIEFSLP